MPDRPKDVGEMDLTECRDWLARDDGWKLSGYNWTHETRPPFHHWPGCRDGEHPIDGTLWAIAGTLPDGWWWERCWNQSHQNLEWIGWDTGPVKRLRVVVPDTGDEILDRARLAVACRLAAKKGETDGA